MFHRHFSTGPERQAVRVLTIQRPNSLLGRLLKKLGLAEWTDYLSQEIDHYSASMTYETLQFRGVDLFKRLETCITEYQRRTGDSIGAIIVGLDTIHEADKLITSQFTFLLYEASGLPHSESGCFALFCKRMLGVRMIYLRSHKGSPIFLSEFLLSQLTDAH